MRNKIILLFFGMIFVSLLFISLSSADDPNVCCEKTTSGLYCQDVPSSQCSSDSRQVPTACASTSYCKPGVCYDSSEGTCLDNTPQIVCNLKNKTWSETSPPQCQLGCCVLGDQAAFVSLVRCKKLSADLGLQTNYKSDIKNEVACVVSVQNQDKGACVFTKEFEKTCKFTTRADCLGSGTTGNSTQAGKEFFNSKLCSAEELGTNCGKTRNTLCVPGKDEVYFVDSCGNSANIYDANKIDDNDYWSNVKDKSEACNPNSANSNSASCGNCNYPQGSFCRSVERSDSAKATYGNFICKDLNCKNTQNGKSYKHGESWCVYDDAGTTDEANNAVGSRYYTHVCNNGQEVLEQCADFRQEECIQGSIKTTAGTFSQAACRVNRWQDCTAQREQKDCENTDRRDCLWQPGLALAGLNKSVGAEKGICVPKNTPGLKFWEEDSQQICAQGNAQCIVTFEKGLFGGESCSSNCECLTDTWKKQKSEICLALGDCGPKINWVGDEGYKPGFKVTVGKATEAKK